ncbi:LysR family transcriptional regulator [Labrenzia sp. PHM005]|uniref:LysR family transcriptional regulator n=1 Tax=Labrenzia sp. PHM005 TaxID=2590016 RepID=UPI001140884A|nr:LysR family transcriptional regulator [Labrenzia sp. PHM005]QDG76729.1 LysR family transcriptional regulator [Labrenzia sp. PHM005]
MNLIDAMRAFVSVYETGSFTSAADKLGTSKTLVSKKVQALENRLGTRLFNRTTRSLSPTEAGQLYHSRCVQVLDDIDELEDLILHQSEQPRGRLHVSAPTTFGELYVAPLLPEFTKAFPCVSVDLSLSDRHVHLVDEGFDVAVRIADLPSSGLIARKLAPSPIYLCASPTYLKEKGTPEKPNDLGQHQCIIDTNFRNPHSWPFHEDGNLIQVPVEGGLLVNSARAVRDYVLAGCGLALCPGYMVHQDIAEGRLKTLLSSFNAFEINAYAIYNSKRNMAPKVRVFVDFLAKKLQPVGQTW